MKLLLDDMIAELKARLAQEKGIRNRFWLEQALQSLVEYRKANEKAI